MTGFYIGLFLGLAIGYLSLTCSKLNVKLNQKEMK